jgi:hypothetical protein
VSRLGLSIWWRLLTAALAGTHPTNWRSILMKSGFSRKEKLTIKAVKPNALMPFQ